MRIAAPGLNRRRLPAVGPSLAIIIILAATIVAGYFIYVRVRPAPVTVTQQTSTVTRGAIAATVNATGTVASSALSRVNFRGSGTIAEVLVQIGDQVEPDQPLARLDSIDLGLALQQAQARLDVEQIKLRQLLDGPRAEDVAGAQAALAAAQAKLAGMQYNRPDDLIAAQAAVDAAASSLQELVSPQGSEIIAAEAAVENAQAQLASDLVRLPDAQNQILTDQASAGAAVASAQSELATAQQRLNLLLTPQPGDLTAAQTAVQTAQINLETAQGRLSVLLNATPYDVSAAQAAVDSARGALSTAQRNLALVKVGPSSSELAALQAAVATAQSGLQAAIAKRAADYDAAKVPVPTGAPDGSAPRGAGLSAATIAQLLADDSAVSAVQSNLGIAQEKLAELQQSPTSAEIAAANTQVDAAQATLTTAQSRLDALVNPRTEDVAAAQGEVDSARAVMASAQSKLQDLVSPSSADVAVAQRVVDAAQSNVLAAREREAQMTGSGASSSLVAAQTAVDASTASLRSAQAKLDQLRTPLESDVRAAEQALLQARAKLVTTMNPSTTFDLEAQRELVAQSQANLDLKRTPYLPSDLDAQRAAVRQAQSELAGAQFNLDNATLTAPFSGIVSAVSMNPGETAAGAAATITGGTTQSGITLVNPLQVRADVQIGESDIPQVEVGQAVNVTFDALPSLRVPGQVSAISPSGTTSQGVVSYLVSITLTDAQAVRPGMTATAEIITTQKNDVLMVPSRAITRQGQNRTVQVVTPTGTEARKVQVGTTGDQYTEIVAGVEEGDQVVLPTTAARAAVPGAGLGGPSGGGTPPGGGF